ncbi:hypothetical protein K8R78_07215 [bacterium]|nr:hypothetical protein [bacterium]
MYKFTLLATMIVILIMISGCDDKELNDDICVEIFFEISDMEDEMEIEKVLESYGTTFEEFDTYIFGLVNDPERLETANDAIIDTGKVFVLYDWVELVLEKNPSAQYTNGLVAATAPNLKDEVAEDDDWGEDLGRMLEEELENMTAEQAAILEETTILAEEAVRAAQEATE